MAKTLLGRVTHKHDTEANWKKALNFIPKQAEIIVYDKDDIYDYIRLKVGDGTTKINDLPFTSPLALALNETETQLVASTSVSFSLDAEHNTGLYVSAKNAITISSFAEGQKYRVVWDGKTYFVYGWRFTALKADGGWYDWQLIGNGNNGVIDGYFPENTDLPFAITQDRWENAGEWLVYAADGSTAATHTIEIYKIDGEYTKVTPEYIYNYNNFLKQGRAEHSGYVGLNSIGENMPSSFAVGDGNTLGGTGQCVFAAGGGNTINCTKGFYSEVHGSFNNVTGERVNSTFVAGQKNTINASGAGAVSVSVFGGGNTITGRWQATTVDGYGQKLDGSTGSNLGLFVHGYSNTITNENAGGQLGLSAVLGGFNKLIHTTTGSIQGNFILGVSNTIQDKSEVFIGGAGNSADIDYQTIFGKFSEADTTAALKVGWGTSGGARKNIFVVHDDGRATAAADPTASMDLVTKQYSDNASAIFVSTSLLG